MDKQDDTSTSSMSCNKKGQKEDGPGAWIREDLISPAPAYPVEGFSLKSLPKYLLNIPIKILGRRQNAFNIQIRRLFDAVRDKIEAIDKRFEDTDKRSADNENWMQLMAKEQTGLNEWLGKVAEDSEKRFEVQNERFEKHENWMQSLGEQQKGQDEWFRGLSTVTNRLEKEIRALSTTRFEKPSEPRIIDQNAYEEKIQAMGGDIRINIGCGEKPLPDYINIDMREVEGCEVVAESTNLPWASGTLAEIASFHLVEHFNEYEFKTKVLPYWHDILKEGGVLRIVCPNWEAILRKLNEGAMDLSRFKELTFGGQAYEGDDHFNALTPDTLVQALEEAGFMDIEFICKERDNSGCPEMEVVARKNSPSSR